MPDLLVALGDDVEAVARPADDGVRHGPRHHLVILHKHHNMIAEDVNTGKAMQHMTGKEAGSEPLVLKKRDRYRHHLVVLQHGNQQRRIRLRWP